MKFIKLKLLLFKKVNKQKRFEKKKFGKKFEKKNFEYRSMDMMSGRALVGTPNSQK